MFQVPRGTRDFTPEEMEKRRYIERTWLRRLPHLDTGKSRHQPLRT